MEYKVIITRTNSEMDIAISTLISEGWMPQGGISISVLSVGNHPYSKDEYIYAQAVVRD